jgi:hypothetical protein
MCQEWLEVKKKDIQKGKESDKERGKTMRKLK